MYIPGISRAQSFFILLNFPYLSYSHGNFTVGSYDFMGMPWPAARMTIDKFIDSLSKHKKMTKAIPCDNARNHASVITGTVPYSEDS
jgi:hypothetical protein